MSSKRHQLRRTYRRRRQDLSRAEQQTHAQKAAKRLATSGLLWRARKVAAYVANDGELDPTPALDVLSAANKQIALPVIGKLSDRLEFFLDTGAPYVLGKYDIPVPPPGSPFANLLGIDVALVPLVACDRTGTRIGMGGGYYDRTLARLPLSLRPLLVGLAHSVQLSETALPEEAWDIRLDFIVTEDEVIKTRR